LKLDHRAHRSEEADPARLTASAARKLCPAGTVLRKSTFHSIGML